MTHASLHELVARLQPQASALAAIGSAIDARLRGVPADPAVKRVLLALDADRVVEDADDDTLAPLLGELRTYAHADRGLLFAESRTLGWCPTDAEVMHAAGAVTALFPPRFARAIAPTLGDLSARLSREGARFLDVGVGVGALSIGMARTFPALSIVGVDTWAPALALARANVREVGLADRVELRVQSVETMPDTHAFDLAWLPSLFIPERALPLALDRAHGALRPEGWLLVPIRGAEPDPLVDAIGRLRVARLGGSALTGEEAEASLTHAGFTDVRRFSREEG
jgi:SAM-dependent methyltransferase